MLKKIFSFLQEEEKEEEQVKTINSVINAPQSNLIPTDFEDGEDLLLGLEKYDIMTDLEYDTEMEKVSELESLRNLVKELEEREVKLEGELLEYYGLKEQESDITDLQKQLKIKNVEIEILNSTISTLHAERKKLQEEIGKGNTAKKELEVARKKIMELQRQIQLDANQTKGQLLLLKQQVTSLQSMEEAASKKDAEAEKKLKDLKELEVVVVELRRKNKELQLEKRELVMKLNAAEARAATLSDVTEVCFFLATNLHADGIASFLVLCLRFLCNLVKMGIIIITTISLIIPNMRPPLGIHLHFSYCVPHDHFKFISYLCGLLVLIR